MSHTSDSSLHAVILAGGVRSGQEFGNTSLPRALWPLAGEPVISGVIRFLKSQQVNHISVCANGKTKLIAEHLAAAKEPWEGLHYSEDRFPRGPAGCLKDLESHLGSQPFVVIQGTACYNFDLQAMIRQHVATGAAVTVGAVQRDRTQPASSWEPAGVYVIDPAVLKHVGPVGYQDLKEQFLPKVREAGGKIICHRILGDIQFIHGMEHYLDALPAVIEQAGRSGSLEQRGYRKIQEGVWAHTSAVIDPSARFVGPVWIEENATVGADAIVLGPTLVGPSAEIGASTLVRRVALLQDAKVNNQAEVADTVLAPGVRVERRSVAVVPSVSPSSLFAQRKPVSLFKRALRTMDLLAVKAR